MVPCLKRTSKRLVVERYGQGSYMSKSGAEYTQFQIVYGGQGRADEREFFSSVDYSHEFSIIYNLIHIY